MSIDLLYFERGAPCRKLIVERGWYGYRSMVFKYNNLAGSCVPKRGYRLCAGGLIANVAAHAIAHSRTVFADHDQQQVFFRPGESGCERDLAIRVEARGAVKLKLNAQSEFTSLRRAWTYVLLASRLKFRDRVLMTQGRWLMPDSSDYFPGRPNQLTLQHNSRYDRLRPRCPCTVSPRPRTE
jgi:hypothetical protein